MQLGVWAAVAFVLTWTSLFKPLDLDVSRIAERSLRLKMINSGFKALLRTPSRHVRVIQAFFNNPSTRVE